MKNLIKKYSRYLKLSLVFILVGQLIFFVFSSSYTKPHYESKIFFTTGIVFDGSDLHKLNEGAHYFGQTMIGWSKFPNFRDALVENVGLSEDASINMHVQERQNMIFTIFTDQPIEFDRLKKTQNYLQSKISEYNENTNTQFVMTNVDYQQVEKTNQYSFGALMTLVLSLAFAIAVLFVQEILLPPRLKF